MEILQKPEKIIRIRAYCSFIDISAILNLDFYIVIHRFPSIFSVIFLLSGYKHLFLVLTLIHYTIAQNTLKSSSFCDKITHKSEEYLSVQY